MGVQMPGPDNTGYNEPGFDAIGQDMSSLAPQGTPSMGVALPGDPNAEAGWLFGADMSGMAQTDPVPTEMNMGVLSDDGDFVGDVAISGQPTVITNFDQMYAPLPGETHVSGTLPGPAMQGLPIGTIPNQGYPNAGSGQQPGGIDSMQGLIFSGGPVPLGEQERDTTGPVGNNAWEANSERQPAPDSRDGTGY